MARNIASRVVSCVLCGMMALSLSMGASAESITETSTEAENAGGLTQAESGDYALQKNDFKIGLSNSFYGNTWRKQMVDSFTEAAEQAKAEGYISDYEVMNGDNTVNTQIAQINSFILEGVDAICINAASSTALNDVIKKAMKQGIKIIAFDSIIDLDGAYTMDYDWVSMGEKKTQYVMDKISGKGNIIIVRGPSGAAPDQGIYKGITNILSNYPDVKIVDEVLGEADATTTQQGLLNVLSSLPEVNAVITHCGADSMGVVNAFESMGKEVPLTTGDNTAEFMKWWNEKAADGYETMSVNSTPSCGAGALWVAVAVLNNLDVPQNMYLPFIYINQDEISQYADMKAGTIASPYMSYDFTVNNIIAAKDAG
ncbi:ABC transporter substrate-binding protein [Porcincola intestinalis]|uniref:ABC transporter substrate-binding protein n=1 Tax=Porcincola intestinalis TaxID=2606632 RepID=UPI0023F19913|nr:ABC transporter substrate-binding protein [Porcincola intestinalis]MCI6766431.1 ABC transporter substrate-binding protein [Lachnospiraceae bacterium]MDD7059549.1 ABC transporter substrate-binding protein [Porcincola intestinalis]MDY5283797.1 ABC transporter substrate-binding protein [Porcincola intestinalis]MDY5579267.1 ABC transporter substrate-binding protein [Porcincola intestinalis]